MIQSFQFLVQMPSPTEAAPILQTEDDDTNAMHDTKKEVSRDQGPCYIKLIPGSCVLFTAQSYGLKPQAEYTFHWQQLLKSSCKAPSSSVQSNALPGWQQEDQSCPTCIVHCRSATCLPKKVRCGGGRGVGEGGTGVRRLWERVDLMAMACSSSYPHQQQPPCSLSFLGLELAKSLAQVWGDPGWSRRLRTDKSPFPPAGFLGCVCVCVGR